MNEMKTVGATYPLFMRLIIIKSSHFMTRGVNRINIIRIKITFKNEFKKSKYLEKTVWKSILCAKKHGYTFTYIISEAVSANPVFIKQTAWGIHTKEK